MKGMLKLEELRELVAHGRDRDRRRRLHRPLRAPDRQALRRRVLRRGRRSSDGTPRLRLPAHRRHGDGAGPGLPLRQLGARLRRLPPACPTSRRCASRAGSTRRRSCSATSRTRRRTRRSRSRRARSCSRQLERAQTTGLSRPSRASELEYYLFRTSYRDAREQGLPQPRARRAGTSRTTTSCRARARGASTRAVRRHLKHSRRAGRDLEGRVGPGPARAQRALRRGARDGRSPRRLQAVPEGGRRRSGHERHLHGEAARRTRRARAATSTSACGATARTRFRRRSSARRGSDTFRWFLGGWMAHAPELMVVLRADGQLVQALRRRARGRRRASRGATTIAPRASASSATATACASSAASPAPTAIRTSPSPPRSRPASTASANKIEPPPSASTATSTRRRTCRTCRARCAEATDALREERRSRRARSARTWSSTTCTSSAPSSAPSTRP